MSRIICTVVLAFSATALCRAEESLADRLGTLDANVLPQRSEREIPPNQMVRADLRRRLSKANEASTAAWKKIRSREDWERWRDERIAALRRSLGTVDNSRGKPLDVHVSGRFDGEGFTIQNLVFQTRPGLWATANLYLPVDVPESMPGILICHSHHRPKEQGELQDMGMTWARLGCAVLVMDQLGHGERREHPFRSSDDYPEEYRVSRQDYHFRYITGMQLHLVGESLIGWMAGDLMRGVDLLLEQPGIDPGKIILLGAVAGGGDPAAVTAALDDRIAAVVPFNFGGPQPENRYPLPDDAERSFNYAGSGSWESTRNLRLSARDGFLPWVIVGSVAPRRLVYAHEFAWDRQHDPVWQRFEQIYALYNAAGNLASLHGEGSVRGSGPGNTHCTNIGAIHREQLYPWLQRWFGMEAPVEEYRGRLATERLQCWTPELLAQLKPAPLRQLLSQHAAALLAEARKGMADLSSRRRREKLRREWTELLGEIEPQRDPTVRSSAREALSGGAEVRRIVLETEPGIVVPLLLLMPGDSQENAPRALVIGVAAQGKAALLKGRNGMIAELLDRGAAVCLPDLRGTGETRSGDARGRRSAATALSSTALMRGKTMVGDRLRDMRATIGYLRTQPKLASAPLVLWGDSLSPVNQPADRLIMPLELEPQPHASEPLGGMLALLGALYEPGVAAVYVHSGLADFAGLLEHRVIHAPHETIVPGALTRGDLPDLAAALAPLPLRMSGLVDGANRVVSADRLAEIYRPAQAGFEAVGQGDELTISVERPDDRALADWMIRHAAPAAVK